MNKIKVLWDYHKKINGVTQLQAAEELGWSQSTLSQFISGRLKPNTDAVIKLSDYFEVDPVDIDSSIRLRRIK